MADAADATLLATRSQNNLIGLTLFFAVLATFAAFRSANAAHKALTGLERPYVVVEPTTTLGAPNAVHVGFAIVNYGRSPATIRNIALGGIEAVSYWEAFARSRYSVSLRDLSIFLPDKTKAHRAVREVKIEPRREDSDPAMAHAIYVLGRVRYDTVLGDQYERRFCWQHFGRDEFREVGGSELNHEVKRSYSRFIEGLVFRLGKFIASRIPKAWMGPIERFVHRQDAKERARHDRPDVRR